jgi:hypothetical protein
MRACLHRSCVALLALLLWTTRGDDVKADGEVISVAVSDDHCDWVMPAKSPPCYVIVGALGSPKQTYRVRICVEPTGAAANMPREPQHDDRALLEELARQGERCRRLRQAPEPLAPHGDPPRRRTFWIFTATAGLEDADNYTQIEAEICRVGKHVQVYVDRRDPLTSGLDDAASDVIRTFDEEVYSYGRRNLGQAADIDRDGRFTVLFSSCLSRLQGGKVSLDGFVRGSDFLLEFSPPFSNRCDMLCLNSRLKAGPHLRTVLAHEYTHAVNFSEHVLYNPPDCRREEESWLNEGLAHLAEDLHQHGWSNLDYRVRAYLAQPHRFPLVIPDYFGSGLWREPGTRGSAFLFLRWCHHVSGGGDLPRRLIQSPFIGMRNVENAMQQSFSSLFRNWAVSMIRDNSWRQDLPLLGRIKRSDKPAPTVQGLRGPNVQTLADGNQELVLAGTSVKFFLSPNRAALNQRFRIVAEKDAGLQVTLISLDERRGMLEPQRRPVPASTHTQIADDSLDFGFGRSWTRGAASIILTR